MPIARLDSPTYPTFRTYLLSNTPVILPAPATSSWPAFKSWLVDGRVNFAHLRATYGDEDVFAFDCSSGASTEGKFGQMLDLWEKGEGAGVYVKDWHLPLKIQKAGRKVEEELYSVSELCMDDWMNGYYCAETSDDFRFVYLGGPETWTPVHRDVYCSYSISTNIVGQKLWTLFPPACTPALLPLLKTAEREDRSVDVRTWTQEVRQKFLELGMEEVVQVAGETIFIPSGWYHQVENLCLTFSLNHNWSNSHNLSKMYYSMGAEVAAVRESISDVKELLQCKGSDSGWEGEWEDCVSELLRQSAGWDWTTFWSMVRRAVYNFSVESAITGGSWPPTPPQARPPVDFIVQQVVPLLDDFVTRPEAEFRWTVALEGILNDIRGEIGKVVERGVKTS